MQAKPQRKYSANEEAVCSDRLGKASARGISDLSNHDAYWLPLRLRFLPTNHRSSGEMQIPRHAHNFDARQTAWGLKDLSLPVASSLFNTILYKESERTLARL